MDQRVIWPSPESEQKWLIKPQGKWHGHRRVIMAAGVTNLPHPLDSVSLFKIEMKVTYHKMNHLKVNNSVACGPFTVSCTRHLHRFQTF